MTDICGYVEELLPRTYYWNLEGKARYSSGKFTIRSKFGEKYKLSLHLSEPGYSDTDSAYLEMSNRERSTLYLDVKVRLHYTNNYIDYSRYDFFVWTRKHKIKIVNVKGVLGITCTISNIRVRFKGSDESGKIISFSVMICLIKIYLRIKKIKYNVNIELYPLQR